MDATTIDAPTIEWVRKPCGCQIEPTPHYLAAEHWWCAFCDEGKPVPKPITSDTSEYGLMAFAFLFGFAIGFIIP